MKVFIKRNKDFYDLLWASQGEIRGLPVAVIKNLAPFGRASNLVQIPWFFDCNQGIPISA
jgi:hypothetical protein